MTPAELTLAMERWRDGRLEPAEGAQLAATLRADPEALATMRRDLHLAAALGCLLQDASTSLPGRVRSALDAGRDSRVRRLSLAVSRRLPRPWPWWRAALVAGVAVALVIWFLAAPRPTTLELADNVILLRDGVPEHATIGMSVLAGDVLSVEGAARLRLPDGTLVDLGPRSQCGLDAQIGAARLHLRGGRAEAQVARQASGQHFTITTPELTATVQGTRFIVSVAETESLVTVRDGQVQVRHAGIQRELGPGDAVRADAQGMQSLPAMQLHWPDRRPILALAIANRPLRIADNPHGWLEDDELDTRSVAGLAHWREVMLASADRANLAAKMADAQGVVVWSLEGWQGPSLLYPGDPRRLAELAPEMDAIADEFFRRLGAGGLATGVVCKPWPVVRVEAGWGWQQDGVDLVADLADKVAYARRRWGCSLIFLGWNLTAAGQSVQGRAPRGAAEILPTDALARLRREQPNVLVFPEFQLPETWAFAPGWRAGADLPLAEADRLTYPQAFPVVNVGSADAQELTPAVGSAVRDGAILIYKLAGNDDVQEQARRLAEFRRRSLTP